MAGGDDLVNHKFKANGKDILPGGELTGVPQCPDGYSSSPSLSQKHMLEQGKKTVAKTRI